MTHSQRTIDRSMPAGPRCKTLRAPIAILYPRLVKSRRYHDIILRAFFSGAPLSRERASAAPIRFTRVGRALRAASINLEYAHLVVRACKLCAAARNNPDISASPPSSRSDNAIRALAACSCRDTHRNRHVSSTLPIIDYDNYPPLGDYAR
jgi:hypothetical protein